MNAQRHKQIRDIFLEACAKKGEEREKYLAESCGADADLRKDVNALLGEHERDQQLIVSEPEGPLGPLSTILSRAGIDVGSRRSKEAASSELDASEQGRGVQPARVADDTRFMDDAHDQTSATHSGIVDAGRFMAGAVIGSRYRIIELLGRGGMGEVYRADDITLNQSIALKFLPALFGSDEKWLDRFRNEVRIARQVTHPNVCRVFDIGEFQGEQFISMEYVDGENLASLLRRIGRLPHDKAILVARQLCAGLAAAHDRGVLHRDLKPANVMIDGRGSVRITDFGLAAPVDSFRTAGGGAIRAGTPAYMSPEQLAGKAITVRSDVYSLGLVLYEMFTGRRAFRAENISEYQRLHTSQDPTPLSQITEDIDPIVERVILRCLEKDPKNRPASAMAVSAALPGGNPLREILAAGETPSPEEVAAAGEAYGAMRPRLAIALLLTALACMIAFVTKAPAVFVVQQALHNTVGNGEIVVDAQPVVLAAKARDHLKELGYASNPRDWAWGFEANRSYYVHVETREERSRLWNLKRPRVGLVYFWYRQSAEFLVPLRPDGAVAERDPPPGLPGMLSVKLDPLGNLIGLEVAPSLPEENGGRPRLIEASTTTSPGAGTAPASRTNWTALLNAAGVDLTKDRFKEVTPEETPPVFADERRAWEGTFGSGVARFETVRLEAAAHNGKPVYFAVVGKAWKEVQLSEDRAAVLSVGSLNLLMQTIVLVVMLAAGGVLAWRNYRSGRGDRQGATRMALAFFLLGVIAWLLRAHHVSDPVYEFILFQRGMGPVLYVVALMWVLYLALEPSVRRVWPETVISWSRLLAGRWFDPLVGRDVLAGAAVGVMTTLLPLIEYQVAQWLGEERMRVALPSIVSVSFMLDATKNFAGLFNSAIGALYLGLILLLFLVLVRGITNRRWVGAAAFVLLFAVTTAHYRVNDPSHLGMENWVSLIIQASLATVLLILLTRHGLVAVIFCLLVRALLMDFPVTWDFSAWYVRASLAGMLSVVVILGTAFYAALGGRFWPNTQVAEK